MTSFSITIPCSRPLSFTTRSLLPNTTQLHLPLPTTITLPEYHTVPGLEHSGCQPNLPFGPVTDPKYMSKRRWDSDLYIWVYKSPYTSLFIFFKRQWRQSLARPGVSGLWTWCFRKPFIRRLKFQAPVFFFLQVLLVQTWNPRDISRNV